MDTHKTTSKKNKSWFFSNEVLEYFDFEIESEPDLSQEIKHTTKIRKNSNFLRDEMVNELSRLKEIMLSNPDLKLEALSEAEKVIFHDFMHFYSICPKCKMPNHNLHLKKLYILEENEEYRNVLIRLMSLEDKKAQDFRINFGVLCCNCFKYFFDKK
ncbi:MAG: hypothetical protein HWN80_13760 [Candidatus Lokiarchaeota archaeon]|nr:hypothetical protein [Candidatus Lokiarchaeota archaeon]